MVARNVIHITLPRYTQGALYLPSNPEGMVSMNNRGIRNPDRYYAKQDKIAKKRQQLVDSAFWNIISIVNDQGGEIAARNKIEALDILIRHGVFGASSKFPVRVSRHRKQEHHQNIAQAPPTEIPEGYQSWYNIATEALDLLVSAESVTITVDQASYVLQTTTQPKPSQLLLDLERQHGRVVETPDPVDADEHYRPAERLNDHLLRTIDKVERAAY